MSTSPSRVRRNAAEASALTIPHDAVWPRDAQHRYRLYGRTGTATLTVLAASPDPGGIGQAIVTLHEDAKAAGGTLGDSGQTGVYDVLGGPNGTGEWLVLPWSRGMNENLVPNGPPFPCPNCGATDEWTADYYQAVKQDCTVVTTESGEPAVTDYGGNEDTYDDGSTDNEAIKCRACGHEIVFARFVLVPPIDLADLRAECEYDPDEDGPVDALIAYKDALEDLVARLLPPTEGGPS